MKIPSEVHFFWKSLYQHGDMIAIKEMTGYSRPTITKAINSGEAKEEVMRAINAFYVAKQKEKEKVDSKLAKELMEQLHNA